MPKTARTFILCLALLGPAALARGDAPQASLVDRATQDAIARLYAKIAAEDVAGQSVAQIIDGVGGQSILLKGLGRAEQIGGPREVGGEVVQVRLQISGTRAAQLVMQAVAAQPDRSPVPPDRLAFHLKAWSERTFIGTGDSLDEPTTVAAAPEATTQPAEAVARVRTPEATPVWRTAPAWVNEPIVSRGVAESVGTQLRTARAAERAARVTLRDQMRGLPSGDGDITVGAATHFPASVEQAIEESVNAARVVGVDYRGDGSVEVRIAADGRRLWQRLTQPRP